MRIKVAGLFCLLLSCSCNAGSFSDPATWMPFEEEQQWGYKTAQGQVAIAAHFQMAQEFNAQGLAAVVDQKGWAYIDRKGHPVVRPFVFDNGPDYFREGLARFVQDGKFGFFDESGKIVIPAQYDFAYPFENGKAKVGIGCRLVMSGEHQQVEGGQWQLIDRQGRVME